MKLKPRVAPELDKLGTHDIILLSTNLATKLGKRSGDKLLLPTTGGLVELTVRCLPSGEQAFVSAKTSQQLQASPAATLGCDPEFLFLDPLNRICRADSFLPKLGAIGCDNELGELRPEPGLHEEEVTDNLRQLIKRIPEVIAHRFRSPHILTPESHSEKHNLALGFHIHLGAPKKLLRLPGSKKLISGIAKALDFFVGLPSLLLEDNDRRRLGDGEYGGPSDWRISAEGQTIEYRTPGGFHLRHPDYARGLLGLALCAGGSILSWLAERSIDWTRPVFLDYSVFQRQFSLPPQELLQSIFRQKDKARAYQLVPELITALQKLEMFPRHNATIRHYLPLLQANRQFPPQLLNNW